MSEHRPRGPGGGEEICTKEGREAESPKDAEEWGCLKGTQGRACSGLRTPTLLGEQVPWASAPRSPITPGSRGKQLPSRSTARV